MCCVASAVPERARKRRDAEPRRKSNWDQCVPQCCARISSESRVLVIRTLRGQGARSSGAKPGGEARGGCTEAGRCVAGCGALLGLVRLKGAAGGDGSARPPRCSGGVMRVRVRGAGLGGAEEAVHGAG